MIRLQPLCRNFFTKIQTVMVVVIACCYGITSPAAALSTDWQKGEFSSLRMLVGNAHVSADSTTSPTLDAGVELRLETGWKTYWRSPGDAGFPLAIELLPDSENVESVTLHWPYPHRFIEEWGLEVFGYKHNVLVPATITLKQPQTEALTKLRLAARYAVCSDICISEEQKINLDIPINPLKTDKAALSALAGANKHVPQANGTHGMSIVSAEVVKEETTGGVLSVKAELKSGGFGKPEIFLEGPAGVRFPAGSSEISVDKKHANFLVHYELSPPAKTLADAAITATLLRGEEAIEAPLMVTLLPGARDGVGMVQSTIPPASAVDSKGEKDLPGSAPTNSGISFYNILLLACIGGLILNVMPCVLPVLSIKMLGAVKHGGGNAREVRLSFLATSLGIITFFIGLATLTVLAKQAGQEVGWGLHFQSPGFLIFLTVLIGMFAANLFGVFEVRLPAWLNTHIYEATDKAYTPRHHLMGDFSTGVFASLMATPCTAPFLGTAVGFALARGPFEIYSIFFMVAVGLALPYLIAALFPRYVTLLPKPGAWMVRVKHAMGAMLLIAALWLLWVISHQAGVGTAVGVWMLVMALAASPRLPLQPVAQKIVITCIVVALFMIPRWMVAPVMHEEASDVSPPLVQASLWKPFDERKIDSLTRAGKVVFVDVTADWCLTCKANKFLALERDEVKSALQEKHVVAMLGDLTQPKPEIEAFIRKYGRYGIPFNVVYGPAAKQGIVLPEILSVKIVLDALEAAQGKAVSSELRPKSS